MAEQESIFDRDPSDVGRTAAPDDPEPAPALTGEVVWNPYTHGIWRRFQFGDGAVSLDTAAVNRARAENGFCGTCRLCGHNLIVQRGRNNSGSDIEWLDFECVGCGHETAAPNAKRLQRSSRHSEMPPGWWANRMRALKTAKTAF